MSNTGNESPGGTPPSSKAPDSAAPDSDGCAEIPTAAHAVLVAEIQLVIALAMPPDVASQLSNTLTLTNDDGSYTKTLTFASDCQASDNETSKLTFEGLTDGHTYSLQGQDDFGSYTVFADITYHDIVEQCGRSDGGDPPASTSPESPDPIGSASGAP
jgi:hypothetical protein